MHRQHALVLLLAACAAPMESPIGGSVISAREALAPSLTAKANLLLGAQAAPMAPGCRTFTGPSSCLPAGGINPFLCSAQAGPVVGEPFTVAFWTRALPIPQDTSMAWIVVGFTPVEPVNFSSMGMPGCYLLVSPDAIIGCPVGINDGMLTRSSAYPGRIALRWTPQQADLSRRVWMQLLVAAPGENAFGLLASHAIEVQVGDPNWRNQPYPELPR